MYGRPDRRPGANPYQSVSVDTASPAARLLMLFDGSIRFCRRAIRCMERDDIAGKGVYIGKAQAIVQEFQASLRHDVAPELCDQLTTLYAYIVDLFTQANLQNETFIIDEAIQLLETLRAGFAEAVEAAPSSQGTSGDKASLGRSEP